MCISIYYKYILFGHKVQFSFIGDIIRVNELIRFCTGLEKNILIGMAYHIIMLLLLFVPIGWIVFQTLCYSNLALNENHVLRVDGNRH